MTTQKRWLLASAVVAVAVYVALWCGYVWQWDWLAAFDSYALTAAHSYGATHPAWVTAWNVFCTVAGPAAFRLIALVLIVAALVRRNLRVALFLLVSVELSGLVIEIAKRIANRPRPATAFVEAWGSSFPSGHAVGVLVGVLALLLVTLAVFPRPLWGWLIALGAVIVVAIGAGRVVLNVHHPSDVLAGWALGYAYFVLCLVLIPPMKPVTESDETPEERGIAR